MGGVKVRTFGYLFMRLVVEPTPTHIYPLLRNWMYTTFYELSGEALFHFHYNNWVWQGMAQEYAPQKVVMSEAVLIHIYLKYSVQNAHWTHSEITLNRPEIIFILIYLHRVKIHQEYKKKLYEGNVTSAVT